MADITILCKRTVVSTMPVQPGLFDSLSALDHIMEPTRLQLVFYYHTPPKTELGSTIKKLRESLSETLTYFPKVTGRLLRTPEGRWRVRRNDAGIRTMEAIAKGSVEDWLLKVDSEKEQKLVYWEEMYHKPYFWSTFYIQLTEFEGGGIAIGLSCSHLVADVVSATALVKAWACTTLLGKVPNPPHFGSLPLPRVVNKDKENDLIKYYKASLERRNPYSSTEKYTTVMFAFSDEMVRKCSEEASTPPFAALAATFWLGISKVKGKRINMSICMDGRDMSGLDKDFPGNFMIFNKVCGEESKEVAKAIVNTMEKMGKEEITDLIQWLEANYDHDGDININGSDLMCANWENLEAYSAIFESGENPLRVSYSFERVSGDGQVLILPAPPGGGTFSRVAMVTLPEAQAVKLCEEDSILRFSPTILVGN